MKKVVICDFDGTIIHGNLENTFVKYLLKETGYGWWILMVSLFTLPINILLNRLYKPSIFKSWTYILKEKKREVMDAFFNSDYYKGSFQLRYREDVISKLDIIDLDYMLILTGSDEELVKAYLEKNDMIKCDKVIGSQVKKDFFRVERHPFGKEKMKFVNRDNYNIGIANDFSDHFYMDMCDEKYYV